MNNLTSDPTCKCGCGLNVKFLDAGRGFSEYIRGHAAKIKNNYQTKKSIENSLKTRKHMIENGLWKPFRLKQTGKHWALGLTKETDFRIAKICNSINTAEITEAKSKRMKLYRNNGIIPTVKGNKHHFWRGGISSLNNFCRGSRKLYSEWKLPKIIEANNKCIVCFSNKNLHVHHDKKTFSEILREIAVKFGWTLFLAKRLPVNNLETMLLKQTISDAVAQYHIDNNISGIVLCEECHKKEHSNLNFHK